jgi:hypothetical protein
MRLFLVRTSAAAIGAVLVCTAAQTLQSQVPGSASPVPRSRVTGGTGGGGLSVSPSVVATYMMQARESDLEELVVMVLWRGRPGWYRAAPGVSSGGSSFTSGTTRMSVTTLGGIELSVRVSAQDRTVAIKGREFDLRRANAFLVDRIDEPDGPVFVDNFYIEARLPSGRGMPDHILPLLRASPDIIDFLRCGTATPAVRGWPDLCAQLGTP